MKDSRRELAEMGKGNGVHQFEGRDHHADKMPKATLRLEYMQGTTFIRGESIPYSQIVGFPLYIPGTGIRFLVQTIHPKDWNTWKLGVYRVTLTHGPDKLKLLDLWRMLCQFKLEHVREGEEVGKIEVSEETMA